MLFNRVAVFAALLMGVLTSQLPEFAQQYRQRLGGAIDELQRILQRFDADAAQQGMNRSQGIAQLETNPDPFIHGRGLQMSEIESRLGRLDRQMQDFNTANPLVEFSALLENFDTGVAQTAYRDFTPALPVTAGGVISGLLGFAGGWVLLHLCAWPVRRRRRLTGRTRNHTYPA
jgi:hypothetical protein